MLLRGYAFVHHCDGECLWAPNDERIRRASASPRRKESQIHILSGSAPTRVLLGSFSRNLKKIVDVRRIKCAALNVDRIQRRFTPPTYTNATSSSCADMGKIDAIPRTCNCPRHCAFELHLQNNDSRTVQRQQRNTYCYKTAYSSYTI